MLVRWVAESDVYKGKERKAEYSYSTL